MSDDSWLPLSPEARATAAKALGRSIGFDDVGVAPPGPFPEMAHFDTWLERGYHGELRYMARHRRRRAAPALAMPGTTLRGVLVAALDYDTRAPHTLTGDPERGWISRYAWGDDYHGLIEALLTTWCAELTARAPGHRFTSYVDHGPVLEKVFGKYAGLGWMGKHTNLIHPKRGSYFFLAVVLTDLAMAPDTVVPDHCGSCTACLDVCPTQAFPEPGVLDARRCISYLTIESPDAIPEALVPQVAPHVFGCDLCQDVCPWNRKPEPPDRPAFQPREDAVAPRLDALLALDDAGFDARFSGTPVARRGREAFQRVVSQLREAKRTTS